MNTMMRLLAWVLALLIVMLPVVGVLQGWIASERWPISKLSVTAEYNRVSAMQIQSAVARQAPKGFFAVRIQDINAALESLPWVARSTVRKQWPDTLVISIEEHRPYARWNDQDLLSAEGDVFTTPGAEQLQGLPQLRGPQRRLADVVSFYQMSAGLMQGSGLQVQEASISERGSYQLTLSDGSEVIVGRNEPELRLQRFAELLPRFLATEGRAFSRADLRYSNGLAILWKDPQSAEGSAASGEDDSA